MLIKLVLITLLLTKFFSWVSTLVQAIYLVAIILVGLFFHKNITNRDIKYISLIFILITASAILNESNYIYCLKNSAYIFTMPLLNYCYKYNWFNKNFIFIFAITLISLIWYQLSPSSYITDVLSGNARMIGFGVTPNVFALICLIFLCIRHEWDQYNSICKNLCMAILLLSIYYSHSQTAILLLPICFSKSIRSSILYIFVLILSAFILWIILGDNLTYEVPSLFGRFDLWSIAFENIEMKDLLIGKGYDYFGAGIGTLANDDVRIVDSFFISSFISGGLIILTAISYYYFLDPLKTSLATKNYKLFNLIIIFLISNFFGNFLENGFPANIIFWMAFMQLKHKTHA